jgi:hypothetical protein|tara:strand:+ start:213 stop:692 length:480 start_codon:yes stop_codon:yes gene_type:complete
MIIKKNFLDLKDYQQIKEAISSGEFPWYFNETSLITDKNSPFQFVHVFLNNGMASNTVSILNPLLSKLKALTFLKIKANLNTRTHKIIETGEHVDADDRFTSAVFFLNECNGYCKIGNKKIKSEDNKILIFKSNEKHTGSTCTDSKRRMLINVVYVEGK